MRGIIAVALVAAHIAACSLIPSPQACPAALLKGRLASDGQGGALVVGDNGPQSVRWPKGYTVQMTTLAGSQEFWLLDENGRTVASDGEVVYVGGGYTTDDALFVACGPVSRDPP